MVHPLYAQWQPAIAAIDIDLQREIVRDLAYQLAQDVTKHVATKFARRRLPPGQGPRDRILSTIRFHIANITGIAILSATLSDPDIDDMITITITPKW